MTVTWPLREETLHPQMLYTVVLVYDGAATQRRLGDAGCNRNASHGANAEQM